MILRLEEIGHLTRAVQNFKNQTTLVRNFIDKMIQLFIID